jgi:hypothetical protein
MQLLKKIFGDETLELKMQLSLAQLVEEIDRVADQAESIDKALRASRTVGSAHCRFKRFSLTPRQPAQISAARLARQRAGARFPLCSAGARHHVAGFPPAVGKAS